MRIVPLLLVLPGVFVRILRGVTRAGFERTAFTTCRGLPAVGTESGLFEFCSQRRQVLAHRVRKACVGRADSYVNVSAALGQAHFYALAAAVQFQLDVMGGGC